MDRIPSFSLNEGGFPSCFDTEPNLSEVFVSEEAKIQVCSLEIPEFYTKLMDANKLLLGNRLDENEEASRSEFEYRPAPQFVGHLTTCKHETSKDCQWLIDLYLFSNPNPDSSEPYVGIYIYLRNSQMKPECVKFIFSLRNIFKWNYVVDDSSFEQNGQLWGCKAFIPAFMLLDAEFGFVCKNGSLFLDFKICVDDYGLYKDVDFNSNEKVFDTTIRVENVRIQAIRKKLIKTSTPFNKIFAQASNAKDYQIAGIPLVMAIDMIRILHSSLIPHVRDLACSLLISQNNPETIANVRNAFEQMYIHKVLNPQTAPDFVIIAFYLKAQTLADTCWELLRKPRNSKKLSGNWTHKLSRYDLSNLFFRRDYLFQNRNTFLSRYGIPTELLRKQSF